MTSTVVVRGTGGVLLEMDVPAAGHARELFDEKIAKGDLVVVDAPVEWVKVGKVSRLQLAPTVSSEAASVASEAPRRGRPPKVAVAVDIDTAAAVEAVKAVKADAAEEE